MFARRKTRLFTNDIEPEDRTYIVDRLSELEIYSADQINAIAEFIDNRLRTHNNFNNRRIEAITSLLDAGVTTPEIINEFENAVANNSMLSRLDESLHSSIFSSLLEAGVTTSEAIEAFTNAFKNAKSRFSLEGNYEDEYSLGWIDIFLALLQAGLKTPEQLNAVASATAGMTGYNPGRFIRWLANENITSPEEIIQAREIFDLQM